MSYKDIIQSVAIATIIGVPFALLAIILYSFWVYSPWILFGFGVFIALFWAALELGDTPCKKGEVIDLSKNGKNK